MCEFISWIEKEDKNYFLTSADLVSKRGVALRKHCGNDEDLVGHGAIRWFYGEFVGGTQKERTNFSTPNNFPADIVEAIKAGKFRGMGTPTELLNESARAEYDKIIKPARAEFDKIVNAAWVERDKIVDTARAEYDKIVNAARAEYDKIVNASFWDLFADPKNRNPLWV